MASRTSKVTTPPKRSRALLISLASVAVLAIVAVGIWWGTAGSSDASEPAVGALPDDTHMGVVELRTADLEPMREYYVEAVGLEVLEETSDQLSLGNGDEELIRLVLAADLATDTPTAAGLYHSAILYPNERALAETLMSVANFAPASYSGSADHLVSLAFYVTDPDGNGVELYVDRPRDEWVWQDGMVEMGSEPLDPNAFIQEHLATAPGETDAIMGHVHLRVGDLDLAREFYADVLGFAVTSEGNGAIFYSAGGYHHHLATNTWGSAGAAPRPESFGLGSFTVNVGGESAVDEMAQRLTADGVEFVHEEGILTVDDPWGNTVRILS